MFTKGSLDQNFHNFISLSEKLFAEPENARHPKVSDGASKSRKKSPSFDKQVFMPFLICLNMLC